MERKRKFVTAVQETSWRSVLLEPGRAVSAMYDITRGAFPKCKRASFVLFFLTVHKCCLQILCFVQLFFEVPEEDIVSVTHLLHHQRKEPTSSWSQAQRDPDPWLYAPTSHWPWPWLCTSHWPKPWPCSWSLTLLLTLDPEPNPKRNPDPAPVCFQWF